ncbi:coiled-coil domain-containing protein 77-like [Centruroides sculpturatus]|uniref:coiled-coil domain-containing protein 77-like n=1 Tax=Centruroides sculpturatus TaxID=218467 RepID=UPI000C6DE577|nr:coiled-coil domain-containing protein 77-like [Centruroides sculpturatus]
MAETNSAMLEFVKHGLFCQNNFELIQTNSKSDDDNEIFPFAATIAIIKSKITSLYTKNDKLKLEKEIQAKNDEILQLQKALSDIQLSLFQEREHVLQLYTENDRLKVRELEDHKRIQYLLQICEQIPDSYKSSYVNLKEIKKFYIDEPETHPHPEPITSWTKKKTVAERDLPTVPSKFKEQKLNHYESMKYEIEALRVQLEEREALFHEQVDALTNDCNIIKQEAEVQRLRDSEHIKYLTDRLKQTTELLQLTTRDYVNFRKSVWNTETDWSLERAQLIDEINNIKINIKKQREKASLMEELSAVKHELQGHNQQTYLLDEINKLKEILNQFTIPLPEEMKIIKEQLIKCIEQVELQKELCNNSLDLSNKTLSLCKKHILQKYCEQLKNNLTSLIEQINDISEGAKTVNRKNSEQEIKMLKLQNDQKESLVSIKEYLNNISKAFTSLEQDSQENSDIQIKKSSLDTIKRQTLNQDFNELFKISEEYKSENIFLKKELERLKEMHMSALQFYKEKCSKLEEQLELKKSNYQQLTRNHRLDIEGFKNDIKILKTKLVNIEKQLLKTIIQVESNQNDMNLLKDVHSSTVRSVQIADNLKGLKRKLYALENELKKI